MRHQVRGASIGFVKVGGELKFRTHSHKYAMQIIEKTPEYRVLWDEIVDAIHAVSDEDLIRHYQHEHEGRTMSLSKSINTLLKHQMVAHKWRSESPIFGETTYGSSRWRLDFAKETEIVEGALIGETEVQKSGIAVEVAFNHAEAISWNLLKPVLSSELNHVKKNIQTGIGIVICATENLKTAGAFDGTVGTFEQFLIYSRPMSNILSVPILIVGLEAPDSFTIRTDKLGTKTVGFVEMM